MIKPGVYICEGDFGADEIEVSPETRTVGGQEQRLVYRNDISQHWLSELVVTIRLANGTWKPKVMSQPLAKEADNTEECMDCHGWFPMGDVSWGSCLSCEPTPRWRYDNPKTQTKDRGDERQ